MHPKFETGDRIRHKRSGNVYIISDRKHSSVNDGHAIDCDAAIDGQWLYRLGNNKQWRYGEELWEKIE
jgi:hypothetical protein